MNITIKPSARIALIRATKTGALSHQLPNRGVRALAEAGFFDRDAWQVTPDGHAIARHWAETDAWRGAEELRHTATLFGNCSEAFTNEHSAEALLMLARAYGDTDGDILPDAWTAAQVRAAIDRGVSPKWTADGEPIETAAGE